MEEFPLPHRPAGLCDSPPRIRHTSTLTTRNAKERKGNLAHRSRLVPDDHNGPAAPTNDISSKQKKKRRRGQSSSYGNQWFLSIVVICVGIVFSKDVTHQLGSSRVGWDQDTWQALQRVLQRRFRQYKSLSQQQWLRWLFPRRIRFRHPVGNRSVDKDLHGFYGIMGPYYQRLDFYSLRFTKEFQRYTYDDSEEWYEEERESILDNMDHSQDESLDPWDELPYPSPNGCYRLSWTSQYYPTCNLFHEFQLEPRSFLLPEDYDNYNRDGDNDDDDDHQHDHYRRYYTTAPTHRARYLAHGFFKDAWMLEPNLRSSNHQHHHESTLDNTFVLKALRLVEDLHDFSWWTAWHMFNEALVMEATSHSKRTIDIYGHCFTNMLVEPAFEISQRIVQGKEYDGRGRIRQEHLDLLQKDDVFPFNDFSPEEKLEIALMMAESLAELHGHQRGVIINDDVHPDQWLVDRHGNVKLNDFNNARILEWDPQKNEYCKHPVWIGGDYRSPEELQGEDIDEKSDVWPMGANIYALLTGLFPHHSVWDTVEIEALIAEEIKPEIDPRYKTRSFIEGRLVEIMEPCFEANPEARVSIFEVVEYLRETKRMVAEKREAGEVDWDETHAGILHKTEQEQEWRKKLPEHMAVAGLTMKDLMEHNVLFNTEKDPQKDEVIRNKWIVEQAKREHDEKAAAEGHGGNAGSEQGRGGLHHRPPLLDRLFNRKKNEGGVSEEGASKDDDDDLVVDPRLLEEDQNKSIEQNESDVWDDDGSEDGPHNDLETPERTLSSEEARHDDDDDDQDAAIDVHRNESESFGADADEDPADEEDDGDEYDDEDEDSADDSYDDEADIDDSEEDWDDE